ncbi:hypothetical protein O5558_20455 [Escherichia coli]|nr:hypothetical protein [Escherichia coli]
MRQLQLGRSYQPVAQQPCGDPLAGTGNLFFTTDSAACLRGIEIEADVVLKATKVDGVFTADPAKDPTATMYEQLTYSEVLEKS